MAAEHRAAARIIETGGAAAEEGAEGAAEGAEAAAGRRRYWKCACTPPHHLCTTFPTQIILVISENFHQLR